MLSSSTLERLCVEANEATAKRVEPFYVIYGRLVEAATLANAARKAEREPGRWSGDIAEALRNDSRRARRAGKGKQ